VNDKDLKDIRVSLQNINKFNVSQVDINRNQVDININFLNHLKDLERSQNLTNLLMFIFLSVLLGIIFTL